MKIALKITILIALTILAISAYWYQSGQKSYASYPYPDEWHDIHVGMKVKDAHRIVPSLDPMLRDMKGFDQTGVNYGSCYWALWVFVDNEDIVSSVERHFIDRSNDLFSRSWINEVEQK